MDKEVKILECLGPFVGKTNGREFFVAHAETPNAFGGVWSTVRWTALTDKPIKPGTVVPLRLRSFDADKGEGQFYV